MKSLLVVGAVIPVMLFSQSLRAERNPVLPAPYATASAAKQSKLVEWPAGKMPVAPPGFSVSVLTELKSPRSLYLLPSGNVLVSQAEKHPDDAGESSPNQITRLWMRGSTLMGKETFAKGLNLPFGMALWRDEFFVAEPTRVLKYKYFQGRIVGTPKVIARLPFPTPQRHWTRHLLLSPDGKKLYVAVGSASNVGEDGDPLDPRTAAILEMDRDGKNQRIFAGGLRNPVSMAWEPFSQKLWATVNERDELGDGLVPDYITQVKAGGFYGWPYSYWGKNLDPRQAGARPDLVRVAIEPDFSVGAHTASLGITFTGKTELPAPFDSGALVAQHGSWNSSSLVGYKVLYVPFKNGQAVDGEQDFLSGFIADDSAGTVYGRPVASVVLSDGSVLVSDDAGGKIWLVKPIVATK